MTTVTVSVYSLRDAAFADRGYPVEPWVYADGTSVGAGERFRLVAVQATANVSSGIYKTAFEEEQRLIQSGEARVELDALGKIRLVGFPDRLEFSSDAPIASRETLEAVSQGAVHSAVQTVASGLAEGTVGAGNKTPILLPSTDSLAEQWVANVTGSTWNLTRPSSGKIGSGWWLFLVVEDSRAGVAMVPGAASGRVACASAVVMDDCAGVSVAEAKPLFVPNNGMPPIGGGYNTAYVAAPTAPMRPTALPSAVTTASGATYSAPEQIEALFTPAFSDFVCEGNGLRLVIAETSDGKPQSRLDGESVPEGLLYSVFTSTSLAGPWKSLDAVIGEKGLALGDEKGYTRCQLSDLSGRVLPTFEDKTRFYRIQQSATIQGE